MAGGADNHTQFLSEALTRFQQWIQFADAKAGAVLVILGLGVASLIDKAGNLSDAYRLPSQWGDLATLLFWAACAAAAATVVCVSIALFPRVKPGEPSLAYFGHVATMSSKKFETEIGKLGQDELNHHLALQAWELARVAYTKYRWLKPSYWLVVLFLVLYVMARSVYAGSQ
jgi:hypothetical protein